MPWTLAPFPVADAMTATDRLAGRYVIDSPAGAVEGPRLGRGSFSPSGGSPAVSRRAPGQRSGHGPPADARCGGGGGILVPERPLTR